MTTAATAPNKIFLLPPLDSASSAAPPKVNDGAEPTIADGLLGAASAGFSNNASAAACSCGFATTGASSILRAGAGALAAPLVASGEPAGKAGLGGAIAAGAGNCSGCGIDGVWIEGAVAGFAAGSSMSSSRTSASFSAGAELTAATAGHADGALGADGGISTGRGAITGEGVTGAAGFTTEIGLSGAGFGGTGVVATGGTDAAAGVLPGSLLRSRPRATRSVPLACSILMGLVRTRFAPMRNALATPA
jgi:hypothetical protein